MARINLICTIALLYTLLTQIISTDGRNIKSSAQKVAPQKTSIDIPEIVTYDNNLPSLNPTDTIQKNSYKMSSSHENEVESTGQGDTSKLISEVNNHLKAPGHSSMNSDHARKDSIKPNKHFQPRTSTSSSLKTALVMLHENDFQPTAPGISPGGGHTKINKNDKEESGHGLNNKCIDSFRPTAPGDSPGAGHSLVNNDNKVSEQGKRQGAAQTQSAQTNDYQPTPPGHSPAASHPDLHNKKKPNS